MSPKHMLQSLFVNQKLSYLLETEQCMSGGNALSLGRRKRIEHAVVGVNRGEAVLRQLVLHHLDNLLNPSIIV